MFGKKKAKAQSGTSAPDAELQKVQKSIAALADRVAALEEGAPTGKSDISLVKRITTLEESHDDVVADLNHLSTRPKLLRVNKKD